ncbi:MAG TPA: VWA domain-containing protein [Candidatus Acidoferrum sp.]|nr:VWA domain-containing protein [Candidatus Acidoferrum sp.]
MKQSTGKYALALVVLLAAAGASRAQAPEGPMAPRPGQPIQQAPPDAQAKLKVQVALVNMPVTVRNAKGEMVHDLDAKDFRITDNGVEQKILHFDLGGDPVSVVILIETSSRIDPLLPQMRKTGILFTQTVMGPEGEAAVVGFNDAVDKLQDFTTNGDSIENVVTQLQSGSSGSRLYDAMAVGVDMLSARLPQPTAENPGRRRLLLIMSESVDVGSEAKLGEVLRKAQLANVTIYSVGLSTTRSELHSKRKDKEPAPIAPPGIMTLPPPPGTIQTPTTEENRNSGVDLLGLAVWAVQHADNKVKDHEMEVACVATGGAHLSTYKDRSIEKAIDEIGGELHAQYTVSYAPTDTNAFGYHEIKVDVDRKNLKVRARPGYYLAPPES